MIASAMPNMRRALQADPRGFRAFLDIAMLSVVDVCYGNGHMQSTASIVRALMGKPPCSTLPKNMTDLQKKVDELSRTGRLGTPSG
mmetsp:Transcript_63059/g.173223  ORF Transcript_63059/g.173223 Transcript_63059/m.173223 type:complete len:86 (+) Transcript_63059:3-260(+)